MSWFAKFKRAIPSGTVGVDAEEIGCILQAAEPVEGVTNLKRELFAPYGLNANVIKLCRQQSTTARDYPYDGATPTIAANASDGGTTLQLASDCLDGNASFDPAGLLVIIASGARVGVCRRITGWNNQASRIVNVARAWATAEGVPQSGDAYRLLLDMRYAQRVTVAAEYSTNAIQCDVIVGMYDWGYAADSTTRRAARRVNDQQVTLTKLAFTADPEESGYYASQPWTFDARGFLGCKVRLAALTGGSVSLYGVVT